ncbi:hypothetical protein GN244_ATG10877 [Phytophthora infestans]|uniref:Uncharacterized protein n=1 Tax=Phytophthora infestans TaxID=4787 RepID=A0A833WCB9_PHYIN|nr:hypothetical protein GN244_ATG10877 [Phytophthora infestans]KAF4146974.1 hypothetical protein GN958_ATG03861 [Phytophthora infestans]
MDETVITEGQPIDEVFPKALRLVVVVARRSQDKRARTSVVGTSRFINLRITSRAFKDLEQASSFSIMRGVEDVVVSLI